MTPPITAADHMKKASRALAGARLLLDAGDSEGACSRAYYAMFNAAHAALLAFGASVPGSAAKTHGGLIGSFGKHLVQTGQVDAELGRSLNQVQQLRMLADYVGEPPSMEDASWSVERAESFVANIVERFALG